MNSNKQDNFFMRTVETEVKMWIPEKILIELLLMSDSSLITFISIIIVNPYKIA